ncbi:MAG: DUF4965 domain-containing protein [Candidatus Aminicenantes bacterium]|nr:DUF4965 domain-containing protein [Candidatus Aminicenantes bacterium]
MARRALILFSLLAVSFIASSTLWAQTAPAVRPPAVPLVTHDPYFCIWSMADKLTDEWPKHWTGKPNGMMAMVMVDGKPFRIMGPEWRRVPALAQTAVRVYPTRTVYSFSGAGVEVTLIFLSPLLVNDLDIMSRPVTYVTFDVRSADNQPHAVSFYYDACAEIAVNSADQKVIWSRFQIGDIQALSFGSKDQPVLERKGDDLRIDWGYFYLAAMNQPGLISAFATDRESRAAFIQNGRLPARDDLRMPRAVAEGYPMAAFAFDLGQVGDKPVSRWLMLAYDDQFSIEYFYRKLRPYWRKGGWEAADLLDAAAKDYEPLTQRCRAFDEALLADMNKAGGEKFAALAVLAYRQSIAAHKLAADIDGTPLFFPKENFSNGCISTVDVIYPEAPMYLLMNTELMRALMTPVFEYARGAEWKFPFAPHDLGTYPKANGQVYGGGAKTEENQMPVEESGNMLLMTAALVKIENKTDYAVKYWPLLQRWAEYLKDKGLDPENQLCTDDFAGHLAHNANLSIKAILALRGYAYLCERTGKKAEAQLYKKTSEDFAKKWVTMADDGDHYKLAFDKPGTWSQKYNLVWDKILGFNLFPPDVARKEMAFYKKSQLAFGLPLDNRKTYTKLVWVLWTATLAETAGDFAALIDPVFEWLNKTPTRVPLTDWYWTDSGKQAGFQARPVVGGVLIKMLADPALVKKWGGKEKR